MRDEPAAIACRSPTHADSAPRLVHTSRAVPCTLPLPRPFPPPGPPSLPIPSPQVLSPLPLPATAPLSPAPCPGSPRLTTPHCSPSAQVLPAYVDSVRPRDLAAGQQRGPGGPLAERRAGGSGTPQALIRCSCAAHTERTFGTANNHHARVPLLLPLPGCSQMQTLILNTGLVSRLSCTGMHS